MIFLLLLLFLLLKEGCAEHLCAQPPVCHCNFDMGLLACVDSTIQILPNFTQTEKSNTVHMDIANTQLKELPVFQVQDWPLLKIVDLRSNPLLNICSHLKTLFPFPDLTLITDCSHINITTDDSPDNNNNPPSSQQRIILLMSSVVVFVLNVIIVIIWFFNKKCKPRKQNTHGDPNTPGKDLSDLQESFQLVINIPGCETDHPSQIQHMHACRRVSVWWSGW